MNIKKHLTKPTELGAELLALPSIIAHPDMYQLGKESVHMECRSCGMHPTHWIDAQSIKDTGMCFRCDELSAEYAAEARWDAKHECEELGMEWDEYIDMVQERDY